MEVKQRRLNSWRRLFLMPLLLPAVLPLVLVAGLVLPGTALAQSDNNITIGSSGKLIARTIVQISATVTCTVPEGLTFESGFGDVSISQASGRQLSEGLGNFTVTTCDGIERTFPVAVLPQSSDSLPPLLFHGGPAIANGELFVNYIDNLGNSIQSRVSTGLQTIRIRG